MKWFGTRIRETVHVFEDSESFFWGLMIGIAFGAVFMLFAFIGGFLIG